MPNRWRARIADVTAGGLVFIAVTNFDRKFRAFDKATVLACPRCGGRLRLVAVIEGAAVIGRILRHLGLPTEVPAPRPARAVFDSRS